MWILGRDNRGSITIEMCFVMPIVIGIIMIVIFLILKGANEGAALGASQVVVYEFGDLPEGADESTGLKQLQASIMLDSVNGKIDIEKDLISVSVSSMDEGEIYSIQEVGCTREWQVCTDRLRRWQLYGDVLCE